MSPLNLPRRVRAGDGLSVVAPSGPFDADAFDRGMARLGAHFRVVTHGEVKARKGYLAGPDERRRDELLAAVRDPSTSAIIAARGGYGSTRLLPALREHAEEIREANKLLVGFSDITALQSLWNDLGVRTLHAPMVAWLGRKRPDDNTADGTAPATTSVTERTDRAGKTDETEALANAIQEASRGAMSHSMSAAPLSGRPRRTATSECAAPLVGGNLAVLTALVGTPHQPSWRDRLVFLEDVGERPYRVDRMLTTLAQAGAFDGVAGLILGAFTSCAPGADGVSVDEVLRDHFSGASYPVAVQLRAGHIDEFFALPFGAVATLRAKALLFEGEGR